MVRVTAAAAAAAASRGVAQGVNPNDEFSSTAVPCQGSRGASPTGHFPFQKQRMLVTLQCNVCNSPLALSAACCSGAACCWEAILQACTTYGTHKVQHGLETGNITSC